jgi:hypothetical protein
MAAGTAPLSYQWYQGGAPMSGATSSTYTTPVTTALGNTAYTVVVTNVAGTVTSSAATLTVNPIVPALTFGLIGTETFGGAAFGVSASSASSGAVTYSLVSGPATVAANGTVTMTGAGKVVVSASQAASGNYAAATVTTGFTVQPEVPTLTFGPFGQQTVNAPLTVSASSASSGAMTYSLVSGSATVAGNQVTPTATGSVTLSVVQAASGNYATATAQTTFNVVNSTPVAGSLAGSTATPLYGGTVILRPTFSGGTAVIGSAGLGSTNISPSALNGDSYSTAPITTATTYTLTVTGTGGNTATTTFTATPTGSVAIVPVTPANQTVAPGTQTFSATVNGGATNGVSWSASGGSITSGGVWTAPNTTGTYTITATSVDEPSISASTTVTVSAPVITLQPVSKNACTGTTITPSLTMAANYATSYQWYQNGNPLSNDSSILTIPDLALGTYSYSCSAVNGAGAVSTNTVTLNVVSPTTLTITTQPASVSVFQTQSATFAVGASGTGTLTYQWYTGTPGSGTPIANATSSSYTTGALTTTNNGTSYYVTVTDPDCTGTTVISTAATLSVSDVDQAVPPTIIVEPVGQTATAGGTATFAVTASGDGVLTYQWYKVSYSSTESTTAGTAITGATSSTYTVPSNETNDGDNYYVVVTGTNGLTGSSLVPYGSAVSSRVTLAVGAGIQLQITAEPQTDYVAVGTLASFSTTATCTGCIPAYQWYWFDTGSGAPSTPVALSDGAGVGDLSGATVAGSNMSSLTLANVPSTATAGVFYVVVTSTSDGSTRIADTNPLTSSNAGLFVGSLGTIGDTTAGMGLCNSVSNWVLNGLTGNSNGTVFTLSGGTSATAAESASGIPSQSLSQCSIEMTDDAGFESAAVYWPKLISTANFSVSYTVTLSNLAGGTPADGFTMILADPSQGATTASTGVVGEGLGAKSIPGFVLGFDTYQNGDLATDPGSCPVTTTPFEPCDPVTVPYMAVGQGTSNLWENPWTFVNGALNTQYTAVSDPDTTPDYTTAEFVPTSAGGEPHNYVVTVVNSVMTVTMDGYELFSGTVSLPPVAYLGFTASTGGSKELVSISNLTATISAP